MNDSEGFVALISPSAIQTDKGTPVPVISVDSDVCSIVSAEENDDDGKVPLKDADNDVDTVHDGQRTTLSIDARVHVCSSIPKRKSTALPPLIPDSPHSPPFDNGMMQMIQDDHGHKVCVALSTFIASCTTYKLFGAIFLFIASHFRDGVRLYHINGQVLSLNYNQINTLVFSLQKIVDMYLGGHYQNYRGKPFIVLLGSSVKFEINLSFHSVFITNKGGFDVEMKMADFIGLYHEFVRYPTMFPIFEYDFPCMFSHIDRLEARECFKCNGYLAQ